MIPSSGRAARADCARSGVRRDEDIDTKFVESGCVCDEGRRCTHRDLALDVPLANHTVFVVVIEWIMMRGLVLAVIVRVRMIGVAMRVALPAVMMHAQSHRR